MSETCTGRRTPGEIRRENGNAIVFGPADWLHFAAAPTFAIMALLTNVLDSGPSEMLRCSAARMSPLSGMAVMYLLMAAFHSGPWLRLIADRRRKKSPMP